MAVEMFGWIDNLVHGKGSRQELYDPNKPPKPLLHRWLGCGHCDKEATRRFCETCYADLIIIRRADVPSCVVGGQACSPECAATTVELVGAAMRPRIEKGGV